MNVEEYLQKFEKFGIKLGLENIRFLLSDLGEPHKKFRAVHIAGTNGKGATCIFLSSILRDAGYKVGMYLSPHAYDFRERITINMDFVSDEVLSRSAENVKDCVNHAISMGITPTYFEILTAIAFEVFRIEKVDWAVVETGLGGRFDATNVISPEACAITTVEKEHTEYLGEKLEDIAREKGGIIKRGVPVVLGKIDKRALRILKSICADKDSKVFIYGRDFQYERLNVGIRGQKMIYRSPLKEIEINLPHHGEHQCLNASIAITAADILGMDVNESSFSVKMPGRFQIVRENPWIVIDCAHNPSGIDSLVKTCMEFKKIANISKIYTVFGVMRDKDWSSMWNKLQSISERIIFVESEYSRGLKHDELTSTGIKAEKLSVSEGFERAFGMCDENDMILIAGSFYIAGELTEKLKNKIKVEKGYKRDG